jgi:hypothetical protein
MKRTAQALLCLTLFVLGYPAQAQFQWVPHSTSEQVSVLRCDEADWLCAELAEPINYEGRYSGHDEPQMIFLSDTPGSGNSSIYKLILPKEPLLQPTQDGRGGVFNFQLHPAFWFGMALCDTESYPNFTDQCKPDTDANIFDSPDPDAPDYIGHHPGTAGLELQFYPPGWVATPEIASSSQWFAALNTFSVSSNPLTGQENNADCLKKVGREPWNFAIITKNGVPLFPANPLGLTFGKSNPDLNNVLGMNSGDTLLVVIHDTPEGVKVRIKDVTTGESGRMTAAIASGFGQVLFEPDPNPKHPSVTCSVRPYAFHPMYSTSNFHTRIPWAAHSSSLAFSDEIGHFEYCNKADGHFPFACEIPGVNDHAGLDADDTHCFTPSQFFFPPPPFQQIGGCTADETDFDGVSYRKSWPGTLRDHGLDRKIHPQPIRFAGPLFIGSEGLKNYERVAFETSMPVLESSVSKPPCDLKTGANCVNPPLGAKFYPIFSTSTLEDEDGTRSCMWQFGGPFIPGSANTFGGDSTTEYGPLISLRLAKPGGTKLRFPDFRRVLDENPCEVKVTEELDDDDQD